MYMTEAEESYLFFVFNGYLDELYFSPDILLVMAVKVAQERYLTDYLTDGALNVGYAELF